MPVYRGGVELTTYYLGEDAVAKLILDGRTVWPYRLGAVVVTEAGDTIVAVGTLAITGASAGIELDDMIAVTGALNIEGAVNVTEADDTVYAFSSGGAYSTAFSTAYD